MWNRFCFSYTEFQLHKQNVKKKKKITTHFWKLLCRDSNVPKSSCDSRWLKSEHHTKPKSTKLTTITHTHTHKHIKYRNIHGTYVDRRRRWGRWGLQRLQMLKQLKSQIAKASSAANLETKHFKFLLDFWIRRCKMLKRIHPSTPHQFNASEFVQCSLVNFSGAVVSYFGKIIGLSGLVSYYLMGFLKQSCFIIPPQSRRAHLGLSLFGLGWPSSPFMIYDIRSI